MSTDVQGSQSEFFQAQTHKVEHISSIDDGLNAPPQENRKRRVVDFTSVKNQQWCETTTMGNRERERVEDFTDWTECVVLLHQILEEFFLNGDQFLPKEGGGAFQVVQQLPEGAVLVAAQPREEGVHKCEET